MSNEFLINGNELLIKDIVIEYWPADDVYTLRYSGDIHRIDMTPVEAKRYWEWLGEHLKQRGL